MSDKIGIITGTGFYSFPELAAQRVIHVETPYGQAVDAREGRLNGREVIFLPRHGDKHHVPPHRINYRANIHALALTGVNKIIAVNVVGGITETMSPGKLVVPHQVIDYTHGRDHTFFDCFGDYPDPAGSGHIDFSEPLSPVVRQALIRTLSSSGQNFAAKGVYGCTQGPRLETAAEIQRMKNDGCDLVGMTLMPEAALAREKGLEYASLCLVVNWAAGVRRDHAISIEGMKQVLHCSAGSVRALLAESVLRF